MYLQIKRRWKREDRFARKIVAPLACLGSNCEHGRMLAGTFMFLFFYLPSRTAVRRSSYPSGHPHAGRGGLPSSERSGLTLCADSGLNEQPLMRRIEKGVSSIGQGQLVAHVPELEAIEARFL